MSDFLLMLGLLVFVVCFSVMLGIAWLVGGLLMCSVTAVWQARERSR